MDWIFWALLTATALHVVEEYAGSHFSHPVKPGGRLHRFSPNLSTLEFVLINGSLLGLATAAALIWPEHPVFCLSLPALMLVNACMHLVPMVATKRYSPGSVTILLLCAPLSVYAFHLADSAGLGSTATVLSAFALAAFWLILAWASSFIWWAVCEKTGR